MDRDFKNDILGMWKELDAHYDILDNRYYSLEAVIGQLRKDILALEARLVTMGERVTSGEVKDESTGDDIVEIRQNAKEQTQQVWNGIREGRIHARVDTGNMQDDIEKSVTMQIAHAIDKIKLWIYIQVVIVGASVMGFLIFIVKRMIK